MRDFVVWVCLDVGIVPIGQIVNWYIANFIPQNILQENEIIDFVYSHTVDWTQKDFITMRISVK